MRLKKATPSKEDNGFPHGNRWFLIRKTMVCAMEPVTNCPSTDVYNMA